MEPTSELGFPGTRANMNILNTSTMSESSKEFISTILTSTPTIFTSDIVVQTTDFEFVNGTEEWLNGTTMEAFTEAYYLTVLKIIQKWLLTIALVGIMISMGAVITVNDFRETFRHPIGFIIGFVSQFVTMPLICFVTALALDLDPPFALGLLIIGCSPGGTVSNLFTFWTKGDVCLSVCMTSISCVAAIGMMPLNLLIYSRRWTSEQTKVPFMNIFTTLVTIIVPALAGMLVRKFSLKWAKIVSKCGSIAGLATIPFSITLIGIINPGMFSASWKIWTSTIVLPFVGYFFGYGVGRICRQPKNKCRTIGFETGIQNSALAVTIMLLTFADTDLLYDMLTVPCFYGIFSFVDFVVYVLFFRVRLHYRRRNNPPKKINEEENDDPDVKDVEIELGEDADNDCYHGNGIKMMDHPGNKYQPMKTMGDDDVILPLTANGDKKQNGVEKNIMDKEIKITINKDYEALESEEDMIDDR